jgi:Tfp pilus assembly protein PilO
MKLAMVRFSKRERQLVAAAGVTVLLFAAMEYSVLPYWDSLAESSEKIEIQSKRVTSYRRVLGGKDSVKAALATAQKEHANIEESLLGSKTDALANAEIQGLVKELATSKGMSPRRSDVLSVKIVSPEYTKVSTRIEITGTIDQFVALLAAFETAAKILFVEELKINPVQVGNPKNKQIMATLMVSALKLSDRNGSPTNREQ